MMAMTKSLFDAIKCDLNGYKSREMSVFEYLNRSSRPEIADIRRRWEHFFGDFPEMHCADIRNRFRSHDNRQHYSAVFELYLFTLFKHIAKTITVHPETDSDKESRPDFEIDIDNSRAFYLEAKCMFGDDVETPDDIRKKRLLDGITNIKHKRFRLIVEFDGGTCDNPKIRKLQREILSWLDTLNYEEVVHSYKKKERRLLPKNTFFTAGLKINIWADPLDSIDALENTIDTIKEFHPYAMARRGNTHELIKKALREKGKKYGNTGKQVIIAINVHDIFFDNNDIFDALFGERVVYFRRGPDTDGRSDEQLPDRKMNGFWTSPIVPSYTRVLACLFYKDGDAFSLLHENATLVFNPYSTHLDYDLKIPYFYQYVPNLERGDYDIKEYESPCHLFDI